MKRPALTLVRKIMVLAVLVPIAVVAVSYTSMQGTTQLKGQYDNLYGFMLIPIMSLDSANAAQEQIAVDVAPLQLGKTASLDAATITEVKALDATIKQTIDDYANQWITTASPDFTATLAAAGKLSWQTDEVAAFTQIQDAYTAWTPMRDQIIAGTAPAGLSATLTKMRTGFTALVAVNKDFADMSNATAQSVIGGMQTQLILLGLLLAGLGLAASIFIGLSIIRPVRRLTAAAEQLATGDVDTHISETSHDEIGRMAQAFAGTVDYMRSMAEVAGRLAENDLSVSVTARSEKDALGSAFATMTRNLRDAIGEVHRASRRLREIGRAHV
jgi:methyl-accepting chemotaxis protein